MKPILLRGLLILVLGLAMFGFGFGYGSRIGALGEMSAFETILTENYGILDRCHQISCDAQLRSLVISTNDVALTSYASLEALQDANWFLSNFGFALRSLAMISKKPITRSSKEWRSMFRERKVRVLGSGVLGSGLAGVPPISVPTMTPDDKMRALVQKRESTNEGT